MKLKTPAQPLLFSFPGVSALCCAVAQLYADCPGMAASLCLYAGRYYLAVHAPLKKRGAVFHAAGRYGLFCGAAPVLYAYCEEHGRAISANAIEELGAALRRF